MYSSAPWRIPAIRWIWNGPIMVTIRFKTALDDYTKDVKARIRMRLNLQLAGGAQDLTWTGSDAGDTGQRLSDHAVLL